MPAKRPDMDGHHGVLLRSPLFCTALRRQGHQKAPFCFGSVVPCPEGAAMLRLRSGLMCVHLTDRSPNNGAGPSLDANKTGPM